MIFSVLFFAAVSVSQTSLPSDDPRLSIYCSGALLEDIISLKIFDSVKFFLDMPPRRGLPGILMDYTAERGRWLNASEEVRRERTKNFVGASFGPPGEDISALRPSDWLQRPPFLDSLSGGLLRRFAHELHFLWLELTRKPGNVTGSSLLVGGRAPARGDGAVVVPGGRLREVHYFESYFIVRGLLVSGMTTTARNTIGALVGTAGLGPRGRIPMAARAYYANRGAPPLLSRMVSAYHDATGDAALVELALPAIEADYWACVEGTEFLLPGQQHVVDGAPLSLNRYPPVAAAVAGGEIMPELADHPGPGTPALNGYASQSGWWPSTRWTQAQRPESLVPVDLNAFLHATEVDLAAFHRAVTRNESAAARYESLARRRLAAIDALLWSDELMQWLDYDPDRGQPVKKVYASNFAPLWTQSALSPSRAASAVAGLRESGILLAGGASASSSFLFRNATAPDGLQWDYPSALAPVQLMITEGLAATGIPEARKMARRVAQRWLESLFLAYIDSSRVRSSLNATKPGRPCRPQPLSGYGAAIGVALSLVMRYKDELTLSPQVEGLAFAGPILLGISLATAIVFGLPIFLWAYRKDDPSVGRKGNAEDVMIVNEESSLLRRTQA